MSLKNRKHYLLETRLSILELGFCNRTKHVTIPVTESDFRRGELYVISFLLSSNKLCFLAAIMSNT